MSPADSLYKTYEGPLAVIRACSCCKHFEIVRKGLHGAGRGYGMREGNKARGRIIQHIKTAHPERYAEAVKAARLATSARPGRLGAFPR